jgi:hypothetical protein
MSLRPARLQRSLALSLAVAAALAVGCAHGKPSAEAAAPRSPEPGPEVYRRADADRVTLLEHEVERLRADVRSAEEALVAVESGMRGAQTRTEAVSKLAEARIEVGRAAKRAPWRTDAVAEARAKLDEAERQLGEGHVGSAIFFVSRASRIAETLLAEADLVGKTPGTRYVRSGRVNLRAEPNTDSEVLAVLPVDLPVFPESDDGEWTLVRTVSGQVGWVSGRLLRAR